MNGKPRGISVPFFISIIMACSLHGAALTAKYDVSFSVFGKIGEAKVAFERYGKFYHIRVEGGLTGAAANIGQHRREIHESFGIVKEGVLIPDLYKKVRRSDYRHEDSYYVFDHENRYIHRFRFREKNVTKSHFDFTAMRFVDEDKIEKTSGFKTFSYYVRNDLLSLFFNIRVILRDIRKCEKKIVRAIGSRNEKGETLVGNPEGKKRKELMQLMPDNENRLITVVINQDIFKSDKGELYINFDRDYLAKEALLKDVLLFGDIHAVRIWQKGKLEKL